MCQFRQTTKTETRAATPAQHLVALIFLCRLRSDVLLGDNYAALGALLRSGLAHPTPQTLVVITPTDSQLT